MKAKIVQELGIIPSASGIPYRHRIIEDINGRQWEVTKQVSSIPKPRAETCAQCGQPIEPKHSTMRFCSAKCRMRAHRAK